MNPIIKIAIVIWILIVLASLTGLFLIHTQRTFDLREICLTEKLNGDFAWKIETCARLLNPYE